jgi:hypothetical protein
MIYKEFPSPLCFQGVSPIIGNDENLGTRFNINIYCSLERLDFPQGIIMSLGRRSFGCHGEQLKPFSRSEQSCLSQP